jgi:hypothetical protein
LHKDPLVILRIKIFLGIHHLNLRNLEEKQTSVLASLAYFALL